MQKLLTVLIFFFFLSGCGPTASERQEAQRAQAEQRRNDAILKQQKTAASLGAEVAPSAIQGLGAFAILNAQEFVQANIEKSYLLNTTLKSAYKTGGGYRLIFEPASAMLSERDSQILFDVATTQELLQQLRDTPGLQLNFPTQRTLQVVIKLQGASLLPTASTSHSQTTLYVQKKLLITGQLVSIAKP